MKAADLRKSILQAAVQGKLVPQDKSDEPASELLKRIQAEKAALIKAGKLKKEKTLPPIKEDEILYDLPDGWTWCHVDDVAIINPRNSLADNVTVSFLPMSLISQDYFGGHQQKKRLWKEVKSGFTHFAEGDVLLAKITPCFQNQKSCIAQNLYSGYGAGTTEIHVLRSKRINSRYLFLFLKSPFFIREAEKNMTGTAGQQRVPTQYLRQFNFPLPPIDEQQRIVDKVDELMILCDELEAAEKEQDALEKHLSEDLPKSILQAAVQGKLVPQDKNDEPASELLKRIQTEKIARIKAGNLKKQNPLPPIAEDEIPYDLPEGWVWCRLDDICEYIQRGKSPTYSEVVKYPVISQKCIQWSGFCIDKARFIEPVSLKSYGSERFLQELDLLWNSTGTGTLGRIGIYEKKYNPYDFAVVDGHVTVIRPIKRYVLPNYLYYYFSNPSVQEIIEEQADGSTKQKELATSTIKKYMVPLPPFAEQQRIVAKVDELMELCGELKRVDLLPIDCSNVVSFAKTADRNSEFVEMIARGKVDEFSAVAQQAIDDLFVEDK